MGAGGGRGYRCERGRPFEAEVGRAASEACCRANSQAWLSTLLASLPVGRQPQQDARILRHCAATSLAVLRHRPSVCPPGLLAAPARPSRRQRRLSIRRPARRLSRSTASHVGSALGCGPAGPAQPPSACSRARGACCCAAGQPRRVITRPCIVCIHACTVQLRHHHSVL